MIYRLAMAVLVMGLLYGVAHAEKLVLVDQGQPQTVIVLPSGRVWEKESRTVIVEQHCATCLKGHIEQMSGARVDIVEEKSLGTVVVENGRLKPEIIPMNAKVFILIGEGALAKQLGVTSDGLRPGGYRIKAVGNALVLVAHSAISHPQEDGGGLRHAVVDLLEGWGCRYLWPGESGKVVPQCRTIEVDFAEKQVIPPIGQRRMRSIVLGERGETGLQRLQITKEEYGAAQASAVRTRVQELVPAPMHLPSADFTWTQWHGLGGNIGIGGGHAGAGLQGGWQEHGAAHPEWFALQPDGTRDQSQAGGRFRLCKSNPELIAYVAQSIIERINNDPTVRCVSLSPNDGGTSNFCMCEQCRALDPPDAPKVKMQIFAKVGKADRKEIEYPALSDRMVHYWNAVAERVTKVHPNALFLADAYSYYQTPPVRERLHPNLVLRYVPSTEVGWEGWQKAGASRVYWRPNILLRNYRFGTICLFGRRMTQTFHFLNERGMLATDMDAIFHNWSTSGLNYYAAARLNWDPRQDYDAILDDYCRSGFGPAAGPMKKYFTRAEEVTSPQDAVITPENIVELRGYLNDAQKAAGADGAVLARIRFLRIGLNYTDLHITLDGMAKAARDKQPIDKPRAQQLLALHYLLMRDIARRQNMAVNVPNVMWGTGDFASWEIIGGRGYRPAGAILQRTDDKGYTLTGTENNLDEMLAAFGLNDAAAPTARQARPGQTVIEADEEGRVRETPR